MSYSANKVNMKNIECVIFDLDGTLIDSSTSIIKSLHKSLDENNIEIQGEIDKSIIGPPLQDILRGLSGQDNDSLICNLLESFKKYYDSIGYRETQVFSGIYDMLLSIKRRNIVMYIATNKRIKPTEKIISMLNWNVFFDGVYALDSFQGVSKKEEVLEKIVAKHNIDRDNTVYVGDTESDSVSANKVEMRFIMALWGYGANSCTVSACAQHPKDLTGLLIQ